MSLELPGNTPRAGVTPAWGGVCPSGLAKRLAAAGAGRGARGPAAPVRAGGGGAGEQRAADREDADARNLGVEPEGAEDVPGRERAEVVVAGVTGGRWAVETEAASDRGLCAVGATQPVIQPGHMQGRLVAE